MNHPDRFKICKRINRCVLFDVDAPEVCDFRCEGYRWKVYLRDWFIKSLNREQFIVYTILKNL